MVSYCEFVTFQFFILGKVWYFTVSIPGLCILTYFNCTDSARAILDTDLHFVGLNIKK